MGEFWRDVRDDAKEKNAQRLAETPAILRQAGLSWEEHNFGQHFVIKTKTGKRVDLWPSTGRWAIAQGRRGRYVEKLVSVLQELGDL